ncbi:MAG: BREX-2 system adenine-specific DNA-methyltransferase PglX, partial [Actinomycetota bacterium]|nr:BREX-2 system adenine-specific DNA-methyltransferase PglX [Actinomycetota bacterium]
IDLNPYAAAVARFRLLVAALQASGITELADAPAFRINVAVGDSLIHGRREGRLFADVEGFGALLRHRYPTEDEELANRLLESGQYHAVVGNPPYITVKDAALRDAYRALYESAYRQYSLGVPFTERFFDLAATAEESGDAGYVGMITTNTFMKREFGKKLVEDYLRTVELTHIVDTSGAYIPGHGTPTVILFGRHQRPTADRVRAVLGIRGEPGRPADPPQGEVWSSIIELIDNPGSDNDYVSVEDAPRDRYASHPWSLQGGAAPDLFDAIEGGSNFRVTDISERIGSSAYTRADDVYLAPMGRHRRFLSEPSTIPFVTGEAVRDWVCLPTEEALFPYTGPPTFRPRDSDIRMLRRLWPHRSRLWSRQEPNGTIRELGLNWWEWARFVRDVHRTPLSIVFAFVATHNHFVLDRDGKVFKQSAPVIKLPEGAGEDEHLRLLGLLNSSAACFWMKQVFHDKGVGGIGGGIGDEGWEPRYEFDGTKLQQFPLPDGAPLERARELDGLATPLSESLPPAVLDREAPSRRVLGAARERVHALQSQMVALQEELDWECYRLYGLIEEDLTLPSERVPDLDKGQRAFEIVLARQMAAGELETTWFERHGSTPITELPEHWPEDYRALVERRIQLITSDRTMGLLERPEYKRRWNWEAWEDLEREALRSWLLDRLEAGELWSEPRLSTCARLADRVRTDEAAMEAVRLYTGRIDVDLTDLVTGLVLDEAVPSAAAWRYKPSGLRKRREWEHVWDLQRAEDAIDARTELPADHLDHLDQEDAELAKKQQGLDKIPVPPKYQTSDFAKNTYWRLRGKLDVPKERFILYPDTHIGADSTPVVGWAGWDHLDQAQALAGHFNARKDEGAERRELAGLLAGLVELVPWLVQWHNDLDPEFGQRMGAFFASFAETEARGIGMTVDDLRGWRPG